jgi:hypothetical protein
MSKRRSYLVPTVFLICAALVLAGCIAAKPDEERQVQGEGTSGPIPIQVDPTEIPQTTVPMEEAAILPTDTSSSSDQINPTDTPAAVPDEPTTAPVIDETVEIQLDWDIFSVAIGESEKIPVKTINSSGDKIPFSIQTTGDCLTVKLGLESITITAGDEMCEQIITVKAANAEDESLKVIIFDPMVLDIGEGLLIRYTNEYEFVWNSRDKSFYTHVNPDSKEFGIWHPRANSGIYQEGWYPLGSTFAYAPYPDDSPYVASIVVKDSKDAGLLAAPLDYVELDDVWDQGEARVWKAICPKKSTDNVAYDYVALGVIATVDSERPSTEAMRCVRKDYTRQGLPGDKIWDTAGDNRIPFYGSYDWIIKSIAIPDFPSPELEEGYGMLQTGTSMFCQNTARDWSQNPSCENDSANLLVVPLPVYKHAVNIQDPEWISPDPFASSSPRFHSAVRVPFTMIPDVSPECDPWEHDGDDSDDCQMIKANIEKNPFYYVLFEEDWKVVWLPTYNNMSTPITRSVEIKKGKQLSSSETTSSTLGIEVEFGGEVGFIAGGSWSVTLSYQYSWEQTKSYTSYEEETEKIDVIISPGKTMQCVQVISQFSLAYMDGSLARNINPVIYNTDLTMFIEYPPPD